MNIKLNGNYEGIIFETYVNKYQVEVKLELDKYGGYQCLDFLGSYGNEWKLGCIDRRKMRDIERNSYRYFYGDCNYPSGHFKKLHKEGRRKEIKEDMQAVLEDYKRMEGYNKGDYWINNLVVIISKNGIELSNACIGGLESDTDELYIIDYIRTLIENGVEEANNMIEVLSAD